MTQPRTPLAKLLLLFTALLTLTGSLAAATINVPGDSATIQGAIDGASNGDTVQVAAGTYTENINFNGKNISVIGAGPDLSIIDGGGSGSVVTCTSGETSTTVLDGFTITNGTASNGGGMYNNSSSPTVTNCTFSGNTATLYGGGGMANYYNSSPTVTNCTFSGNTADDGGGMYNKYYSTPTVSNCTFSGNTASNGGGMYNNYNSSPTVSNCILWGDSPDEIINNGSLLTVRYSDVQGDLPGGTIDGGGNIDIDPLFVDADGPDNTAGTEDDNLRLSGGSPCIDAGSGFLASVFPFDLDGNQRIVDDPATTDTGVGFPEVVDMGAYEFGSSPALCISQLEGDINCDGIVNLLDQALLALHWLETN